MRNKRNLKEERGITLMALIITIIILVILALITVNAAYKSGIIQFGVNGAKDYAKAAIVENEIMNATEGYISSVVEQLKKMTQGPEIPKIEVEDYGKFVEYDVDINGNEDITDDWMIFYQGTEEDGEANGRVFLIASDWVLGTTPALEYAINSEHANMTHMRSRE